MNQKPFLLEEWHHRQDPDKVDRPHCGTCTSSSVRGRRYRSACASCLCRRASCSWGSCLLSIRTPRACGSPLGLLQCWARNRSLRLNRPKDMTRPFQLASLLLRQLNPPHVFQVGHRVQHHYTSFPPITHTHTTQPINSVESITCDNVVETKVRKSREHTT